MISTPKVGNSSTQGSFSRTQGDLVQIRNAQRPTRNWESAVIFSAFSKKSIKCCGNTSLNVLFGYYSANYGAFGQSQIAAHWEYRDRKSPIAENWNRIFDVETNHPFLSILAENRCQIRALKTWISPKITPDKVKKRWASNLLVSLWHASSFFSCREHRIWSKPLSAHLDKWQRIYPLPLIPPKYQKNAFH